MTQTGVLREVSLTLPMRRDMELAASRTAMAMAESMQMAQHRVDEVRMAVVEACINAIEHSAAADGHVKMRLAVLGSDDEAERLEITISDTGRGFVPGDVEEPRIEEKLTAESKRGWGLKIIRSLMDEVEIQSGATGTILVMSKLR